MCKYYDQFNGEVLSVENVEYVTGYNLGEIIEFTGLNIENIPYENILIKGIYPSLEIEIVAQPVVCRRKILFDKRIIYNLFLVIDAHEQAKGLGLSIFYNQVEKARSANFLKLKTDAAKEGGFNGYYTWAKFGYSIINEDEDQFIQRMKEIGQNHRNIHDLLSTQEGVDYWKSNGFSFEGQFILDSTSINSISLDNYYQTKRK